MNLEMADGRTVEATRDNTSLFTHLGRYAIYDHIFVVTDEHSNVGSYIFSSHKAYEPMSEYMWENDYPMHLNLTEAAKCDIKAWNLMVHEDAEHDLEAGIPEEWENE